MDAIAINSVINGTGELPFVYATAFAYEGAAVGDHVEAVFQMVISGATVVVPTYARVVKAGLIGIYSNVKIPLTVTGSIKLLKA